MAISDYQEAQGAVMRARELRKGAAMVHVLLTSELKDAMSREASRLEAEVRAWVEGQECPREADALANRRFWELDVSGRLLPASGMA